MLYTALGVGQAGYSVQITRHILFTFAALVTAEALLWSCACVFFRWLLSQKIRELYRIL